MTRMQGSRTAHLIDDLEAAFTWMISVGVDVGRDRFAAYLKIAQKWDELADGRGKLGAQALQPIVATLAYDAAAFTAAHRAFKDASAAELGGLVKRLGDAARGPIRIEDARSAGPNPMRDAMFETLTAATLHQAESGSSSGSGSGADGTRKALTHGRHHVHVECQRLDSGDVLDAGMLDACRRLLEVFDAHPGPRKRGLIALDASRLATAQPASGQDETLPDFIARHVERIQRSLSSMDRRIIGAMVYASTLDPSDDGRDFVQRERWAVIPRHLINISEFDLLGRLREVLHEQARERA